MEIFRSTIGYTLARLAEWGRWGRLRVQGYPRSSAFVPKVRGAPEPLPETVAVIDQIVTGLAGVQEERHHYTWLTRHYLSDGPVRQRIKQMGVSSRTYYKRLDEAQWAVHVRLAE